MNQYNQANIIKNNVKLSAFLEQKRKQHIKSQRVFEGVAEEQPNKKLIRNMSANIHSTSQQPHDESRLEKYSLGSVIGKGSYAIVRMGTNKANNYKVAIKVYDKQRLRDPLKSKNVVREISILGMLDNQYVIKLLDVVNTHKAIHLVMEYAGQVSLLQHLKQQPRRRLAESTCKVLFRQLVTSVGYLHTRNIVHRDLKLENIMYIDDNIKLIDFGFALQLNENQPYLKTFCGTPCYMAPEMLVRQQQFKGQAVDIWALGVVLYVLLTGNFPFRSNKQQNMTAQAQEQNLFKKIKENNVGYPEGLSGEAIGLMKGLLKSIPQERLSIQGILNHKWLVI